MLRCHSTHLRAEPVRSSTPTREPPGRPPVPVGRIAAIAICAGIIAAAASSAQRGSESAAERAFLPPVTEPREVVPTPAAAPAPGTRFARTFDVKDFRRGNLHTHSNRSDGDSDPADVYAWYRDHGYDFVALTDHNSPGTWVMDRMRPVTGMCTRW